MSHNESIVENLEWFGALVSQSREIGHGPHLAPGKRTHGQDSFDEVVMAEFFMPLSKQSDAALFKS